VVNAARNGQDSRTLPSLLKRGWRPSAELIRALPELHPEFFWTHPHTLALTSIPREVGGEDIVNAVATSLSESVLDKDGRSVQQPFRLIQLSDPGKSFWAAGLMFKYKEDADSFLAKALRSDGIELATAQPIPCVNDKIESKKMSVDEAEAAYSVSFGIRAFALLDINGLLLTGNLFFCQVHPTSMNKNKLARAKKEYKKAKLGLRIVRARKTHSSANVVAVPSHRPYRTLAPSQSSALFATFTDTLEGCNAKIAESAAKMAHEKEKLNRLHVSSEKGVSEDVQAMSTFDSLQLLSHGEREKTQCVICLEPLGAVAENNGSGVVTMTKCGHLYCRYCLSHYMSGNYRPQCPSCRKGFDPRRDLVHIDPSKDEDWRHTARKHRERAKTLVQEASKLLAESNGQLDPDMWEQLYRSIDLPAGIDASRDGQVSAIPRDFLVHLRSCTGMPVHCRKDDFPSELDAKSRTFSSKVRSLLRDLPRNERSVVFSSSKPTIEHVQFVLKQVGIGCRALFTGQKVEASEQAVADWQSGDPNLLDNIPCPVLLVQSGAAASGLTLTAACKMFLMEPFIRYEEEQQAYARCHRFGQERPVKCVCYYTPVSVESRLLEWRKRAAERNDDESSEAAAAARVERNPADQDTRFVYKSMESLDDDDEEESAYSVQDDDDEEEEENADQTDFLLDLQSSRSSAVSDSDQR
jgi:hypothetical protein